MELKQNVTILHFFASTQVEAAQRQAALKHNIRAAYHAEAVLSHFQILSLFVLTCTFN